MTWDEKKILVGKGRNFHGRPISERPFSVEAGSRALSRFYPLHLHPQMHGVRTEPLDVVVVEGVKSEDRASGLRQAPIGQL